MYYTIKDVFTLHQNMSRLGEQWDTDNELYKDPSVLGLFLDNHDVKRFLNDTGDVAMLKNALTFMFFSPGIPIMYYGTEQELRGGNDPY